MDDNRRVESSGGSDLGNYSNVYRPDAPFADFVRSGQNSSLTSTGFSALGYGDAYSDYDWSSSWSFFDVSFSLTTDSTISLSGALFGEDQNYGSGDASLALYSGTELLVSNILYSDSVAAYYGFEDKALSFDGVLAAGNYRILAKADPYFQIATSSYNVQASIEPVPVPAALWLFGSGLIGLAGFARRKKIS